MSVGVLLDRPDRARAAGVLVLPGWPRGYCPVHAMTGQGCATWRFGVRREFAIAAADLEEYWRADAAHKRWEQQYGSPLPSNPERSPESHA